MESTSHQPLQTPSSQDFQEGNQVIYGLHGRCLISKIMTKQVAGQSIRFYKLDLQKPTLSRSKKKEPSIWLPLNQARKNGLRHIMSPKEIKKVREILSNREYYFSIATPWHEMQPELEQTIFREGSQGLAKVVSYLYVLKQKSIVPPQTISKFDETVRRCLIREIAEIEDQPLKNIETEFDQLMKHKLLPDS